MAPPSAPDFQIPDLDAAPPRSSVERGEGRGHEGSAAGSPSAALSDEGPAVSAKEPTPRAEHLGRVVDPDVADDEDDPPIEELSTEPPPISDDAREPTPPVRFMGRVVDPDVAEEGDPTIEELSTEPPPIQKRKRRPSLPDEPSLRPHTANPMPSSEDLLDPLTAPPPIPPHAAHRASPSVLSPRMTAVFGTLFGLAGIVAIFAILIRVSPQSAAASTRLTPERPRVTARPKAKRALEGLAGFEEEGPALPGPWRVSALEDNPNIRIISGKVGINPFVKTLQKKGVSKRETYRILAAFKKFDAMKRPRKNDTFVVAVNRAKGKVTAFELKVSDLEIYQARENDQGLLVGKKLDMKVATRLRSTAIRITGGNLEGDLKRGRLRPSVTRAIDAAFDGRASLSSMPKGSTLRVILQEKTALGRFAAYDHVEALEYVSSKSKAKPLRLYRFKDGPRYGYFDQSGREPYRGGWRRPCPGAPITSPFNLKRMHPILHTIRPHNGTDFGAPRGTPIHATSYGTIDWIGPRGAAGNLIIIKHPGHIESYYMHMNRFAPGLKKGDKVETFQVIGQVGTTGRSTGPHLHFGMKRNGKWVNPMSFKLDGHRLVSSSRREAFQKVKATYDKQLDAIPVPPVAEEAPPDDEAADDNAADDNAADDNAADDNAADDEAVDDRAEGHDTPGTNRGKPAENADDEELEPAGSVDDEPVDEAM